MFYAENLLHYVTTMVCVAVRGVPTIGVIYRPFVREMGIIQLFISQLHFLYSIVLRLVILVINLAFLVFTWMSRV